MKEILLLADTPNIGRSVLNECGPEARPDYRALLALGRSLGEDLEPYAFVNDGVNRSFVQCLKFIGYEVVFSHARDTDEPLVAKAVTLHHRVSHLVLASGDGGFCALVDLLHARGIWILLAAVPSSCSRYLRELADAFVEIPLAHRRLQPGGEREPRRPNLEIREGVGRRCFSGRET